MEIPKKCSGCGADRPLSDFRINKKSGNHYNPCYDCRLEAKRKHNASRLEIDNKLKKEWAENNKEKVVLSKSIWKENNIGKVKADKVARKERIKIATPKWLSEVHKLVIESIYERAELSTLAYGIKYQVDHIIPLRGKNVCGLHVPWNLEIITEKENNWKSNKLLSWRSEWNL